ncbi:MAG: hypothetical protein QGI88_09165 [SAR202 cluster bacterium]|jgi:hypothetical protein|nr:hypothetical protein [SAR202 cluster bacterium]|tara:strand:+ start:466 stop:651 length:186 start_codon:yes stop_codon:yes gene_type:complete
MARSTGLPTTIRTLPRISPAIPGRSAQVFGSVSGLRIHANSNPDTKNDAASTAATAIAENT